MGYRVVIGVVFVLGAFAGVATVVILTNREDPISNRASAEQAPAGAVPSSANYFFQHDWSPTRVRKLGKNKFDQEITLKMDANRVKRPGSESYFIMIEFEGSGVKYFFTVEDARSLLSFYNGVKGKERPQSESVAAAFIHWRGRMLHDFQGEQFDMLGIKYDYAGTFKHERDVESFTVMHLDAICELLSEVFKDLEALKASPRPPLP